MRDESRLQCFLWTVLSVDQTSPKIFLRATQKLTLACIGYARVSRDSVFLRAYDTHFVGVHIIRNYPTPLNLTIAYHMHAKFLRK